jgi:hypothetical protein
MGGIKSGKEAGRGTAAGEAEFSLLRGAEGRGGRAGRGAGRQLLVRRVSEGVNDYTGKLR